MTQAPPKLQAIVDLQPGQQWVCYNKGKIPYTPKNGAAAKADDPNTWGTYQEAVNAWNANRRWYAGIGRELLKEQGITVIDLDKCIDENGQLSPYAQYVVKLLNSYTEYSPSDTGLHIWARGSIPNNIGSNVEADGDKRIEMKDRGGYFTVTGKHLAGTPTT